MTLQNPAKKSEIHIEVWSDVVCPWCYIGKRRLETALSRFARQDLVTVTWRSYQLNPTAPQTTEEPTRSMLARKYGVSLPQADAMQERVTGVAAQEGLRYRLELTKSENTLNAHRLLHMAQEHGLQDELKERLLAAYFTEGASMGDQDTLIKLAVEVGLNRTAVVEVLSQGDFAEAVRADAQRATELGIQGVPFFVLNGRLGVSGAQSAEVLLQALEEAAQDLS
jgi:predicted DsbA family dithiol-disulfide isomerase